MQRLDWNDLHHLLAIARGGSFNAAGRLLRVNGTTVARRLKSLETGLAVRLFERLADGQLRPTPHGAVAIARAEAIESEVGSLTAAVQGADLPALGTVRLTTVPLLANHVLVPAMADLGARHPGLHLDLIADPRGYDLSRREADIALRLARPENAVGARVLARRVATLRYAAYKPKGGKARDLPWIGYEESMAHLPQARWLAAAAKADGRAMLAVRDGDTLLQAIAAGIGRSLLPRVIGDRDPRLARIPAKTELPQRELWLLTHKEQRSLTRVAAVIDWIEGTFQRALT